MTAVQYIGSKISLISKSDIRYEGILYTIDPVECTIALAKVKSMGTEDRPTDRPVPARSEVYEYIVFRGSDIRDIRVCQPPKPQPVLAGGLPNDPAILQHSLPGGSTSTQSGESTSSAPETGLGSFMSGISKTKSDAAIGQPVPSLLPLCTANVAASNASTERATQVDHNRNNATSSTRGRGSQPVTPPRGTRRFEGQQNRQLSGQRDYNYIPTHPGGFQQNRPYFYRDQQRGYNDNYHFDRRAQYDLTSEGYVDRRFNNNAGFRGNRGGLMNRSRDFQDRRVQNGYMGRPNYYYNNDYYGNNYGYRYNDQSRQYGQNYQGYNPNYSGRGGGQYQQRESRQVNHDSESSGGRRITFNEDYDFETANNEFENLKEKFSELKIDNTEVEAAAAGEATSCTTPAAGDKTEEKKDCEEKEKEKKEDQEEKSDDGNVASNLNTSATKDTPNTKKCYDPTVSFFDNLSNIPPKASNMDRGKEIKRNLETFGERGRMRARRAAMNNFAQQPRVANYGGFRGEFLYANNFRPFNNAFYNNRTRGYPNRLGNGGGGQMDYRSRFQTVPVGGLYRRNRRF